MSTTLWYLPRLPQKLTGVCCGALILTANVLYFFIFFYIFLATFTLVLAVLKAWVKITEKNKEKQQRNIRKKCNNKNVTTLL